jgi:ATP-binding cassette subfamily B (MDR/TAP) protein 1
MVLLSISAAKVGFGIRLAYMDIIFKRDVPSFDDIDPKATGNGTDAMSGVNEIETGLGEKLGIALQMISTIITAFAMAFFKQWKLTLVVSTVIPITVLAVILTVIVEVSMDKKTLHLLKSAENIAKEALTNIRDIFASTAEETMSSKYNELLQSAMRAEYKRAPALGVQYSFEYFFMFCGYSLSFWYGSLLYTKGEAKVGSLSRMSIHSVYSSFRSLKLSHYCFSALMKLTNPRVFFCVMIASSSMTAFHNSGPNTK